MSPLNWGWLVVVEDDFSVSLFSFSLRNKFFVVLFWKEKGKNSSQIFKIWITFHQHLAFNSFKNTSKQEFVAEKIFLSGIAPSLYIFFLFAQYLTSKLYFDKISNIL